MQQYKNDMDKITVSDELKSKILAATDKKIKNSKIITFKKAAAAAAGLAVCISVSGLMHGFITSRNKPQQELKPSVSKTEQPKTEKGDNIPDDTIIGNPLPEDSNIPQSGKDAESPAPRGEKKLSIIMPPHLSSRTRLFSRQRSPSIRIPLKAARRRNPKCRIYPRMAMKSPDLPCPLLRSHRIMHLTMTESESSAQSWGTIFRYRTIFPTDMRRRARICFSGHWFS